MSHTLDILTIILLTFGGGMLPCLLIFFLFLSWDLCTRSKSLAEGFNVKYFFQLMVAITLSGHPGSRTGWGRMQTFCGRSSPLVTSNVWLPGREALWGYSDQSCGGILPCSTFSFLSFHNLAPTCNNLLVLHPPPGS
jgi:hypothetical protein